MPELSASTRELVEKYILWKNSQKPKEGAPTIHVDEVAMKVAAFYERIRTIIDWKEEHLMRRAAIIRKLKRKFLDLELSNFSSGGNIAESLVRELIRGGFFPNDKIEEIKIKEVQTVLDKYIFILKNSPESKKGKAGLQFYTTLLEIAACEIEETLAPSIKEIALIEYMFSEMKSRIKIQESIYEKGILKRQDTDIQIYIAVQQALFKLDEPIISYNLIRYKYSMWQNLSDEELLKFSQNMYKIIKAIEEDLRHPLGKKFYAICEKYDTPYLLMGDILTADPQKISVDMETPPLMEGLVRSAYTKRLGELKKKIRRAALYSTISIFVTKILSLLILEMILAILLGGHISAASIAVDIAIPTLLMGALVLMVKPPSSKNLTVAIIETLKIGYEKEKKDTYDIKLNRQRGILIKSVLSFSYLLAACISFGFLFWIFNYFHFPISSIIINIIFIALILFTGSAVRARAHELTIHEDAEGFLGFVSDVLFLPVMGVGRWLSNTWKQYNAITAFFNALIDMPFSTFIEFLEGWRYFIQEKKEEMR